MIWPCVTDALTRMCCIHAMLPHSGRAGISLHPTSGVLAGTPTSPFGPAAVTVVAQNSVGTSAPVSLTVSAVPTGAPTVTAGLVIEGIDQRRTATTAFADDHIAALHLLDGIDDLLRGAEALADRAAEESLVSPAQSHVAEIARCNTAIMAQLAQDVPNHGAIDEQVQTREGAVEKLYSAVAKTRDQFGKITDECNAQAAEIEAALGGMSGAPSQAVSGSGSSNISPNQLILQAQSLRDAVKRGQAPVDALVTSTVPLIQNTAKAALATATALASRGVGGTARLLL